MQQRASVAPTQRAGRRQRRHVDLTMTVSCYPVSNPARLDASHAPTQPAGITNVPEGSRPAQETRERAISTSVTVIAPPIRVAIWAKGISCIRLAAVRIATSPVPPCPLWQALMIAVSIGYILRKRPTRNPVPMSVATVEMIVTSVGSVKAAISLSHGVSATPIANSSGYVTAVEKNL